jgi:hypothetical protein
VRRHVRASSAVSTPEQGIRLGFVRRALAPRGASGGPDGRRTPSNRPHGRLLSTLLAVLAAMLLAVASGASADERIGGSTVFPEAIGPGGVFGLEGVAVSKKEGGDIYVSDASLNQRISVFKPNGDFVRSFGWSIVPSAATGVGDVVVGSKSIVNAATPSSNNSTRRKSSSRSLQLPLEPPFHWRSRLGRGTCP